MAPLHVATLTELYRLFIYYNIMYVCLSVVIALGSFLSLTLLVAIILVVIIITSRKKKRRQQYGVLVEE